MKLSSIAVALPPPSNTGWGTASKRITEELGKIAFVNDLRSADIVTKMDFPVEFNVPLLQSARGVDMLPLYPHLCGSDPYRTGEDKNIAYCFVEENLLLRKYALNAQRWYSAVVCGSTWATREMRKALGPDFPVYTAIQGVDSDIFAPHPEERKQESLERFNIWSAGKFEWRKSQDVVIRAVGVMMQRHKDVYLKASWWNPWIQSMNTMMQSRLIEFAGVPEPVGVGEFTRNAVKEVCLKHLDMDRVEFIGQEPHGASVKHINQCDVGLFLSRCEAGTNLPLCEAMSCGLPVIATVGHGHKDVTGHMSALNYMRDYRIPAKSFTVERGGMAVAQWDEPDLEAVVEALESAYKHWQSCDGFLDDWSKANRSAMYSFPWHSCAEALLRACEA